MTYESKIPITEISKVAIALAKRENHNSPPNGQDIEVSDLKIKVDYPSYPTPATRIAFNRSENGSRHASTDDSRSVYLVRRRLRNNRLINASIPPSSNDSRSVYLVRRRKNRPKMTTVEAVTGLIAIFLLFVVYHEVGMFFCTRTIKCNANETCDVRAQCEKKFKDLMSSSEYDDHHSSLWYNDDDYGDEFELSL